MKGWEITPCALLVAQVEMSAGPVEDQTSVLCTLFTPDGEGGAQDLQHTGILKLIKETDFGLLGRSRSTAVAPCGPSLGESRTCQSGIPQAKPTSSLS